jgi:hypothetical protein
MNAVQFHSRILMPAIAWVQDNVPAIPFDPLATRFLLAIAGQESAWAHRAQILNGGAAGAARGFWQCEGTTVGLVADVLKRQNALALKLCEAASVKPTIQDCWRAIEGHDGLAVGFARLRVKTDPARLPVNQAEGWAYYLRCWAPGKPKPETWPARWAEASALFPGV